MNTAITTLRERSKRPAQVLLAIVFIWFAAPGTNSIAKHVPHKLLKPKAEHVQIHLEFFKQHTFNSTTKGVDFIVQSILQRPVVKQRLKLLPSFSHINAYVRNSFYVFISINAP